MERKTRTAERPFDINKFYIKNTTPLKLCQFCKKVKPCPFEIDLRAICEECSNKKGLRIKIKK
jgi:hypothetical protein